jgi:phage tail-like protein
MGEEAYAVARFYILIDGLAQATFMEVSGLQIETEVLEYAEGGNNGFVHKLPGRTRVSNLTLKRGFALTNALYKWYAGAATGRKIERKNVSLVLFDAAGEELIRWNFIGAYPVKWIGPQFDASSTMAVVETLELAHAGLQME